MDIQTIENTNEINHATIQFHQSIPNEKSNLFYVKALIFNNDGNKYSNFLRNEIICEDVKKRYYAYLEFIDNYYLDLNFESFVKTHDDTIYGLCESKQYICKISFEGIVTTNIHIGDLIKNAIKIKTDGENIYAFFLRSNIVKKINHELNIVKEITLNFLGDELTHDEIKNLNVIGDEIFSYVHVNGESNTLQIEIHIENKLCKIINNYKDCDLMKNFNVSDEIYVMNSNYAILVNKNNILLIDIGIETVIHRIKKPNNYDCICIIGPNDFNIRTTTNLRSCYISRNNITMNAECI